VIDAGTPHRLISRGHRARHKQVPSRLGRVAFHLDLAIEAVMDCERENPRRPSEEASDRLAPLKPGPSRGFPTARPL
jgi:hypothetical protein